MEILVKIFEFRNRPAGDVFKVKVKSLDELRVLFNQLCEEDGKRTGSAYFKKEEDNKWLEYEEFIVKYFEYELRLPDLELDMEFLGFEDGNGNFEKYEPMKFSTPTIPSAIQGGFDLLDF